MKMKNGTRNYARLILWTAAAVNIPRYAGAFIYADLTETPLWLSELLNYANIVGGVSMGIIEAVSIAFIMDGLRQTPLWSKGGFLGVNWRWVTNLFFGVGMMTIAIIILVPFMLARMNGLQMRDILTTRPEQGGWNLFVVLAPIFIIAGASFSQSDFIHRNISEGKQQVSENQAQVADEFPKDWRKMTKDQKRKLAGILRGNVPDGKKKLLESYGIKERTADNYYNSLKREGFLS